MEEKKKIVKFDLVSKFLIAMAIFIIIASFGLPYILTQFSWFGFSFNSTTGAIGDTIGGIINPFIAIAGILITFLAFYVQSNANQLQRDLFDQQIKEERRQFKIEQEAQKVEFTKNQFENQFYEMIKLHKDNVNDIFVNIIKITNENRTEYQLFGRKNFEFFLDEVEIAFEVAKRIFINQNKYFNLKKAYSVVFHGIKNLREIKTSNPKESEHVEFMNLLLQIKKGHRLNEYKKLKIGGIKAYTHDVNLDIIPKNELYYDIFDGYSSFLGHYYRQLYQTVNFIVRRDFLTYEEKRKYLRIIRAQLTNYEQVMLFYNWLSGFGKQWENENNKFFTDFRMIHNVYDDILIGDFSLAEEFNLEDPTYEKENHRKNDPLFEFEDW